MSFRANAPQDNSLERSDSVGHIVAAILGEAQKAHLRQRLAA
jgi:hypothetical protein